MKGYTIINESDFDINLELPDLRKEYQHLYKWKNKDKKLSDTF